MWWLVLLLAVASGALAQPVRADALTDTDLCAMGASGRAPASEAIEACNNALQPSLFGRVLRRGELSPSQRASILFNLASIYARTDSLLQAQNALASAIGLDPGNARAYQLRAQLEAGNQDYRGAIRDYSAAIQLEPGRTSAYLGRAKAFNELKQYAAAKDDYEQVLRREPGNQVALAGRDAVNARLRAMQASDAPSGGNGSPVDDIARALGAPPPSTPPADATPPAASSAPSRQAAAPPAPAAPADDSAQLEGTEGRQQAIVSQAQQGLVALGFKVVRTDGKLDESTRQAMRKFASQQKVKAPEVPDEDFLTLVDQAREAKGLAAPGPPSGQTAEPQAPPVGPEDPVRKARVVRAQKALATLGFLQATPNGKLGPATKRALGDAKVPSTDGDVDESVVAQLEDRAELMREQKVAQAAQAAREREKAPLPAAVAQKQPEPKGSAPSPPPETRYAQLPDAAPETRKIPPAAPKDADTSTVKPVPPPVEPIPQAKSDTQPPTPPSPPLTLPDLTTGDIDRVALVIGNGKYDHYPLLRNPPNDAADMRKFLERVGFRVFYGVNLNHDQMNTLTIAFHRAAQKAQIAFAFYAGHGVQDNNTNYLIPTDVHIVDDADLRLLFRLNDMIRDAAQAAKLGVIAVDACRDSPFVDAGADTPEAGQTRSVAGLTAGFTTPQLQPHTLVVYSTAATSTAEDGVGRNSPFTTALLNDLEDPRDVRFVFGKVVDDVAKATNNHQRPDKWDALGGDQVSLVRPEIVAQALEAKLLPVERSAIQRSLVRLSRLASVQDGDTLSPAVREAIKGYQRDRRDTVTGYLTADEMAALHADARTRGSPLVLPKFDINDLAKRLAASPPDRNAIRLQGMLYDQNYESGSGFPKIMPLAVSYYRKAAEAGDVGAALDLARILANGSDGLPADPAEAARWLKVAASAGQADGEYELAKLVLAGRGVPKNPDEAARLFRRAADHGSGEAVAELRVMGATVETRVTGR